MWCVVLCFIYSILFCFVKEKEYKMKYKKICFLCIWPNCFPQKKIILDLITSLLNLENLANIKTNREINSWELTINFR